jgi:rhodanese-related sulfurtransferase
VISFLLRLLGLGDSTRMSPADFVAMRAPDAPILDVRTPGEYASGHLSGAVNVDVTDPDFEARVAALEAEGVLRPGAPVYLYCRSGNRSARATGILRGRGYDEAWNVGGFNGLREAGAEVGR